MVGTAHVAPGSGGGEGSGVDFTEYRVNTGGATGDWVRSENTGDDDPFATTFTVDDEGSTSWSTAPPTTPATWRRSSRSRSRSGRGSRRPGRSRASPIRRTGAAPLRVQFSATGLDPQGGELTYEWDFGDGSGSFNQSPEHVYTTAGTYTAKVTGTDPQGKTGSATVTIVVTPPGGGNQAPVVRATADPKTGQAPLGVVVQRAGDRSRRPASQITYLWDFDDNGANAFGRNASHTYTRAG